MLYRKISKVIEEHLNSDSKQILLIDGARQVGKTFIIREVGQTLFKSFIEINLYDDSIEDNDFSNIKNVDDFYFQLGIRYGKLLEHKEECLIFIDEIQVYPRFLTLLKFLAQDGRCKIIASGSLLGIALFETASTPIGSIRKIQMYPMDFEEFLYANGTSCDVVNILKEKFKHLESLDDLTHNKILNLFKKYMVIGGMPQVVATYIKNNNMYTLRNIQKEILDYYVSDAAKYDNSRKLKVTKIYELLPSYMENKKKRIVVNKINNSKWDTFDDYDREFDYLKYSGIAIDVKSITDPKFPLLQSTTRNLIKYYLNDVGLLSARFFSLSVKAIMEDIRSVNLGALYETVVATELVAHGYNLYYYDNRKKGEVDFIIDDYESLSCVPLEVKSGRDYKIHSALNNLINTREYNIKKGYVLSNNQTVEESGNIIYIPIYYIMFFTPDGDNKDIFL